MLISVNPFKRIKGLCDDEQVDDYKNRFRHEVPPNIFALAEEAYRAMKNQQENQCVIITCVLFFFDVRWPSLAVVLANVSNFVEQIGFLIPWALLSPRCTSTCDRAAVGDRSSPAV